MFRADSKLMKMLTKIANMLIVSVLWCICCIPVITIIPACAALFHTTVEIIQGNGMGVVRDFLLTFREEIAKGIFFTLGSIIVVFLLSVCVYFGWRNYDKVLGMFYLMLGIVLLLFTILVLLHLPVVFFRIFRKTRSCSTINSLYVVHAPDTGIVRTCFAGGTGIYDDQSACFNFSYSRTLYGHCEQRNEEGAGQGRHGAGRSCLKNEKSCIGERIV